MTDGVPLSVGAPVTWRVISSVDRVGSGASARPAALRLRPAASSSPEASRRPRWRLGPSRRRERRGRRTVSRLATGPVRRLAGGTSATVGVSAFGRTWRRGRWRRRIGPARGGRVRRRTRRNRSPGGTDRRARTPSAARVRSTSSTTRVWLSGRCPILICRHGAVAERLLRPDRRPRLRAAQIEEHAIGTADPLVAITDFPIELDRHPHGPWQQNAGDVRGWWRAWRVPPRPPPSWGRRWRRQRRHVADAHGRWRRDGDHAFLRRRPRDAGAATSRARAARARDGRGSGASSTDSRRRAACRCPPRSSGRCHRPSPPTRLPRASPPAAARCRCSRSRIPRCEALVRLDDPAGFRERRGVTFAAPRAGRSAIS